MQQPSPTDGQNGRRHRRPSQPVAGHPEIPVHERHVETQRAAGRGSAMGRVVHMDMAGVWVLRLNGELAEIDGQCHWPTQQALTAAANGAGIALSSLVIRTGRAA